jgi:hypothetical protein
MLIFKKPKKMLKFTKLQNYKTTKLQNQQYFSLHYYFLTMFLVLTL